LLTAAPSKSTVHAPQLVVSHPVWVPVSRSPCRRKWASRRRGSTSAVRRSPLTVMVTRRTGTASARSPRTSSNSLVISGRSFSVGRDPGEDRLDERVDGVPFVAGAAAGVGSRGGSLGGEVCCPRDGVGVEGPPGEGLSRGRGVDGRPA